MRFLLRMGVISAAFRPKRTIDARHTAALTTHHLGEHVVVFNVNRICRDLGRRMAIADVPGNAQQPEEIVGTYLEELLRCRFHQHETIIVKTQRIAIVEDGRFIEIEQNGRAAVRRQRDAAAMTGIVVKCDAVSHTIGLDGGAANDGRGPDQNRKYRCAIGRTFAGSHTNNSPSAVTA